MKLKMTLCALAATSMIAGAPIAQASIGSGELGASETQRHHRGNDRRNRMQNCTPGSASTSTTGSARTTRNSANAEIATRGSARGSGTVRSSSEGDVYASTDRSGSEADAYGNSTAEAREPTRRRC